MIFFLVGLGISNFINNKRLNRKSQERTRFAASILHLVQRFVE
jgi:hypothetical protein